MLRRRRVDLNNPAEERDVPIMAECSDLLSHKLQPRGGSVHFTAGPSWAREGLGSRMSLRRILVVPIALLTVWSCATRGPAIPPSPVSPSAKMSYWEEQRVGANLFSVAEEPARLKAARASRTNPSPSAPIRHCETGSLKTTPAWCRKVEGTPADLNALYRLVVAAIREVDPATPVIVESGFYATPWTVPCLQPLDDPNTLYSFHMYEPYAFVWFGNRGKYTYPGMIPVGESDEPQMRRWDEAALDQFLEPVRSWATTHRIPAGRILVGEFGAFRESPGADRYHAGRHHLDSCVFASSGRISEETAR